MPRSSGKAGWVLFLLFVFGAINFADKGVLGLAAAPLMAELRLSAAQYGFIASSFYLLFIVSAVLVGFAGNRMSSSRLLVAIAVIWAVAQLPILLPAAGFTVLVATRILLGVGEGPVPSLMNHTVFTWYPPRARPLPVALVACGSAAGIVFGAPVLELAIVHLGWRSAFGILGVLGLIWAVLWLAIGRTGGHNADARPADPGDDGPSEQRQPYWRLLLNGTFLGGTFAGFTVYWNLATALAFLPLFLNEVVHLTPTAVSLAVGLPSGTSIVLVIVAGALSQQLIRHAFSRRIAHGLVGAAGPLVAGVAMLVMTRLSAVPAILVAVALAFSAGNLQLPLSNAAIADVVPPRQRAAVLGIWYAGVSMASILSPYVTGLIIDAAPSRAVGYQQAFGLAGILMVVGGVVAALVVKPDRDAFRLRMLVGASPLHVRTANAPNP
ncbi:MFS transporter [Fodinicola acaciae]|uniref:MFS transporter n=1 Tax=Fodinicola acaciae TaxID=2681555 RepID=UPI0013CFCEC9|nr:MFS transporter [Fodinicola acaciae]